MLLDYLLKVLENCKQLKVLEIYRNSYCYNVDLILPDLGRKLPLKLCELNIIACWIFSPIFSKSFFKKFETYYFI